MKLEIELETARLLTGECSLATSDNGLQEDLGGQEEEENEGRAKFKEFKEELKQVLDGSEELPDCWVTKW